MQGVNGLIRQVMGLPAPGRPPMDLSTGLDQGNPILIRAEEVFYRRGILRVRAGEHSITTSNPGFEKIAGVACCTVVFHSQLEECWYKIWFPVE